MAYNPYINSFNTSGDFETYIESSAPKAPNVAYLKDLNQVRYTTMLPNDYVVFGTTTGSTDFTGSGISFKVEQSQNGGDNILYVESSGVPQSLTSLSNCFSNTEGRKVTKIKKWAIDTSNVTNMNRMFNNCSNLTSLDLSSFDTSNVTDMNRMFYFCSNLTSLDLSSFVTSNVTNMSQMFYDCSNLTSLDLSLFDTSNVTNMSQMFYDCSNLTSLDLSSFNKSNVTDMSQMFYNCSNLTSLDLSSFVTSNVTDMNAMFYNCSNLTSLDLSSFDTSNVTNMSRMFYNCSNLTSLDLSSFVTSNVTDMNVMFYFCSILNKLYLSSSFFNSASITTYPLELSAWTDADSLEQFVQAAEAVDGTGKTIQLSNNTKNALTQAQKDRITGAGWTIQ